MQKNLWNLEKSKNLLGIRHQAEAQRRHLLHLDRAKSSLDHRNKLWKIKSLNAGLNKRICTPSS